jgi:hypothetical protein
MLRSLTFRRMRFKRLDRKDLPDSVPSDPQSESKSPSVSKSFIWIAAVSTIRSATQQPCRNYYLDSNSNLFFTYIRLHTRRSGIARSFVIRFSSHRQCEPHEDRNRRTQAESNERGFVVKRLSSVRRLKQFGSLSSSRCTHCDSRKLFLWRDR